MGNSLAHDPFYSRSKESEKARQELLALERVVVQQYPSLSALQSALAGAPSRAKTQSGSSWLSPVGIVLVDRRLADDPVVFANDTFEWMTLYPREAVIGTNCRFLQGPYTCRDTIKSIRTAIQNGECIETEILNYRKDGAPFWNKLSLYPIRAPSSSGASPRSIADHPSAEINGTANDDNNNNKGVITHYLGLIRNAKFLADLSRNGCLQGWSVNEVCVWLEMNNLAKLKTIFRRGNVDGSKLSTLTSHAVAADKDPLRGISECDRDAVLRLASTHSQNSDAAPARRRAASFWTPMSTKAASTPITNQQQPSKDNSTRAKRRKLKRVKSLTNIGEKKKGSAWNFKEKDRRRRRRGSSIRRLPNAKRDKLRRNVEEGIADLALEGKKKKKRSEKEEEKKKEKEKRRKKEEEKRKKKKGKSASKKIPDETADNNNDSEGEGSEREAEKSDEKEKEKEEVVRKLALPPRLEIPPSPETSPKSESGSDDEGASTPTDEARFSVAVKCFFEKAQPAILLVSPSIDRSELLAKCSESCLGVKEWPLEMEFSALLQPPTEPSSMTSPRSGVDACYLSAPLGVTNPHSPRGGSRSPRSLHHKSSNGSSSSSSSPNKKHNHPHLHGTKQLLKRTFKMNREKRESGEGGAEDEGSYALPCNTIAPESGGRANVVVSTDGDVKRAMGVAVDAPQTLHLYCRRPPLLSDVARMEAEDARGLP